MRVSQGLVETTGNKILPTVVHIIADQEFKVLH